MIRADIIAELTRLGIAFDEKSNAKDLAKLLKDNKPEETEAPPASVPSGERAEAPRRSRPVTRDSITVTLPDGTARTYSEKTHGALYETLANNYAEAHDGEIE